MGYVENTANGRPVIHRVGQQQPTDGAWNWITTPGLSVVNCDVQVHPLPDDPRIYEICVSCMDGVRVVGDASIYPQTREIKIGFDLHFLSNGNPNTSCHNPTLNIHIPPYFNAYNLGIERVIGESISSSPRVVEFRFGEKQQDGTLKLKSSVMLRV